LASSKLSVHRVNKPWGRTRLWAGFDDVAQNDEPVGEIWFSDPEGADDALMVKYLFTSERLSIQVHPDDAKARAASHTCGKDEAWLILAAEPNATIALGLRETVSREHLRAAALDGRIVDLMHWRSVKAGDFIYSPAGTVHAIGAGITLIEVQQNIDLTYRLYDYGRQRELHLDDGIAVANPVPFIDPPTPGKGKLGKTILCQDGKFSIERWTAGGEHIVNLPNTWLIPITGNGRIDGQHFAAGECWKVSGETVLEISEGCEILLAKCSSVPFTMAL
jgi:mannose-6-phosphate isomerase